MTEVHEDFDPSYPYSDHKEGDHIAYRLEGHTERGEILFVASASMLASGQHFPPHYVVAPDRGGFPDMVLFSDICIDEEPAMTKCKWCPGSHYDITQCPFHP